MLYPDAQSHNADWTKQSWDLPPYKSKEFLETLQAQGITIEQFRKLPVYLHAVNRGLIVDDMWASSPAKTTLRWYSFKVDGLPPKKDGANSMWGKSNESKRLIKLRLAAADEFNGEPPLQRAIRLTITIHLNENTRQTGDLDNFITGICDGLMAATAGCNFNECWQKADVSDIHPNIPIALIDDCEVVEINARKVIGGLGKVGYEIVIEGE